MVATEPPATAQLPGIYLPQPPADQEKYQYFGKQRRWAFAWLLIAAAGILYGYVHVAEHAWVIAPLMWLLLMVMVPPVVINFWLRTGKPRLTLAEHLANVTGYREQGETVDVFLPSCGEPVALLDNTFRHVSKLAWDGLKTVYVLDDSARDQIRDLAENYGFQYIVRPNPGEMKKAGNLRHALGISAGEFIAVIDADFAVRPEFLYETMPYFADPRVGIVQTAQYFDVRNQSISYIQRYAGTLQEIFFRFIQPARDRYRAAICAGTNLVYRRAAVAAAGGFAWVPIGEDVHSGVKLAWAGYETRYLPICLARGVGPADFSSLANQQTRWCRSSMLLMLEAFPGSAVHLEAACCLLGGIPVLHVVGRTAADRAVPHPDHDLVLPRAGICAQLPADAAGVRGDPLRVPGAEPRLAAHHLPGVHDELLLSHVRHLVCDPGQCRRVGPHWGIKPGRAGPGNGEPDLVHVDCSCSGTPVVGLGTAGVRIRLAAVLGNRTPGRSAAVYACALDDNQQGHLE